MNTTCNNTQTWFDNGINKALLSLTEQYDNAIPVFGGALFAASSLHGYNPDFRGFEWGLQCVLKNARLYKWHESEADTLRRWCHICLVDPALVEAYLGMRFEQYCEEVK